MFAYLKTGYDSQRLIYRSMDQIGLLFHPVEVQVECYKFFQLLEDNHKVFNGTVLNPYRSPIPLSYEDRDFVMQFTTGIIEFRWESDNLVPYSYNDIKGFSCNAEHWNQLHSGFSLEHFLRIFKISGRILTFVSKQSSYADLKPGLSFKNSLLRK